MNDNTDLLLEAGGGETTQKKYKVLSKKPEIKSATAAQETAVAYIPRKIGGGMASHRANFPPHHSDPSAAAELVCGQNGQGKPCPYA